MQMMKGWMTWVGVLGFVATKVAAQYLGVDMEAAETDADTFMALIEALFAATAVVGIGRKIEKKQ